MTIGDSHPLQAACLTIALIGCFGLHSFAEQDPTAPESPDNIIVTLGPVVVRVPTAALILSGQTGGSLQTATAVRVQTNEELGFRVEVVLDIELEFDPDDESQADSRYEVFVYALDRDGVVVDMFTQAVEVPTELRSSDRAWSGIKILAPLVLPPGRYQVRTLARHAGQDRFGLQSLVLDLPRAGDSESRILMPWLAESIETWIVALPAEMTDSGPGSIELPKIGGRNVAPATRLVTRAGEEVRGEVLAMAIPDSPGLLVARLARSDGVQVAEPTVDILHRESTSFARLESFEIRFEVPRLPAGRYLLQLSIRRPMAPPIEAPVLQIVIVEGDAESQLAWVDPGPKREDGFDETGPGASAPDTGWADQEFEVGLVRDEYERMLAQMAEARLAQARAVVTAMETGVLRSNPPGTLRILEKRQWRALTELVGEDPTRLLPFSLVYGDLIGIYRGRDLGPLAEHAVQMSTRVTKTMARRAKTPEAKAEAADALASLAGHLHAARRRDLSQEMLQMAVNLDETHPVALLGLAATFEHQARYDEALSVLETLVDLHPEHAEGRLRLAVNLIRMGKPAKAADLLGALEWSSDSEWVGQIAAQELARLEAARGDAMRATEIVESAAARWVDQPALQVQLAWLLDQQQRLQDAESQIVSVLYPEIEAAPSARYRYNRWYSYAFDDLRTALAEQASRRAAEADRHLSAPGEVGGT